MIFRRNDRLRYIRERGAELGSARPTKGAKENAEGEKERRAGGDRRDVETDEAAARYPWFYRN